MPKMIVSIDGVVIKEVQLTKDRTTLGRRPYNDIVIDNLAVSGEHAVMQMSGTDVFLEDLNSTNGTYVNGKAIKKQQLQNGDTVEIGKYKIKFVHDGASDNYEKTMVINSGAVVQAPAAPDMTLMAARCPWSRWSPPSASQVWRWRPSRAARTATWSHWSKAPPGPPSTAAPSAPKPSTCVTATCWNWPARRCSSSSSDHKACAARQCRCRPGLS